MEFDLDSLPFIVPADSVNPLVFKKRKVLLEEIGFSSKNNLKRPFQEIDPILNNQSRKDGWKSFTGKIEDGHIIFPSDGQYIISSELGVRKILILSDSSLQEEIIQIAKFISMNIIHSGADVRGCTVDESRGSAIYYPNLYRKLFYSDQPLGLICDQAAYLACSLFYHLKFNVRLIWTYCSSTRSGHVCMEIFNEEEDKWIFFDPDYGCMLRDSNGSILSPEEIILRCNRRETGDITTIDLSGKSLPLGKLQYLFDFDGILTWTPDMLQGVPMLPPGDYCKDVLLSRVSMDAIRITEIEINDMGIASNSDFVITLPDD